MLSYRYKVRNVEQSGVADRRDADDRMGDVSHGVVQNKTKTYKIQTSGEIVENDYMLYFLIVYIQLFNDSFESKIEQQLVDDYQTQISQGSSQSTRRALSCNLFKNKFLQFCRGLHVLEMLVVFVDVISFLQYTIVFLSDDEVLNFEKLYM